MGGKAGSFTLPLQPAPLPGTPLSDRFSWSMGAQDLTGGCCAAEGLGDYGAGVRGVQGLGGLESEEPT